MRRYQRQYSKHPNIQLLNKFIVSKKVFKKSIVAGYETEIKNCKDIRSTNTLYLPDIPYDILCNQFSHFFTNKLNTYRIHYTSLSERDKIKILLN